MFPRSEVSRRACTEPSSPVKTASARQRSETLTSSAKHRDIYLADQNETRLQLAGANVCSEDRHMKREK